MVNQRSLLLKTSAATLSFSTVWQAVFWRRGRCLAGNAFAACALVLLLWPGTAFAQSSPEDAPRPVVAPVPAPPDSPAFSQIALDGVFNIAKEFWPDVNHLIFHGKY